MEIIINNTKFNIEIANTFKTRFLGLMGKKEIKTGLIFPKCNSIHTFFMRCNIDIIMLNKNKEIIYYKKGMKKNRILVKKDVYYTIELPENSINDLNLKEKLDFEI